MRKATEEEMKRRETGSLIKLLQLHLGSPDNEMGCKTYWGSHGCYLERGHSGEHICECSVNKNGILLPHMNDFDADDESGNVGRAPYYGLDTNFY